MKKISENINWRLLNLAFWIEIILSYLLPFKIADSSQYQVGFPIPFIHINASGLSVSPFMSMHFNPLGLLSNGVIIYLIIIFCIKIYQKIKHNHTRTDFYRQPKG